MGPELRRGDRFMWLEGGLHCLGLLSSPLSSFPVLQQLEAPPMSPLSWKAPGGAPRRIRGVQSVITAPTSFHRVLETSVSANPPVISAGERPIRSATHGSNSFWGVSPLSISPGLHLPLSSPSSPSEGRVKVKHLSVSEAVCLHPDCHLHPYLDSSTVFLLLHLLLLRSSNESVN